VLLLFTSALLLEGESCASELQVPSACQHVVMAPLPLCFQAPSLSHGKGIFSACGGISTVQWHVALMLPSAVAGNVLPRQFGMWMLVDLYLACWMIMSCKTITPACAVLFI
jgi:hypothetical protein